MAKKARGVFAISILLDTFFVRNGKTSSPDSRVVGLESVRSSLCVDCFESMLKAIVCPNATTEATIVTRRGLTGSTFKTAEAVQNLRVVVHA